MIKYTNSCNSNQLRREEKKMTKPITGLILLATYLLVASPSSFGLDSEKAWLENICQGKEKVAKIHFYIQDLLGGPNQTVYEVARASITPNSTTAFGQVRVLDGLMTAEPDINSEVVGRAQGLITSADLNIAALAINLNFVFTSGMYNGSTISVLGRNQSNDQQRELPVVGGTGVFRFARGYALTSTYSYDVDTEYGVIEYTLYVAYADDSTLRLQANM